MEISTRSTSHFFELVIKSGSGTIQEDISCYSNKGYIVPEDTVNNIINLYLDTCRFNNLSDVDAVKKIFNGSLHESEQREFIETVIEPTEAVLLTKEEVEKIKEILIEISRDMYTYHRSKQALTILNK